jgi:hypothetical protein
MLPTPETPSVYVVLDHAVYYILKNSNFLSLEDYVDVIGKCCWKAYRTGKKLLFGNYLTVV